MEYKNGSALEGLKVLDLGRVIAGPYGAAILADLGADVIKIEMPGVGDNARDNLPMKDGESTYFMMFNRSKKGLTLNLKEGKEIFFKLVKNADVLIENYRPGVMKKMGLDYEVLKEVNPKLIYAAVSGFGQEGPYSQRAGYDPLAQAMSGIMSMTGYPDSAPVRAGASIADIMASQNVVIGILAALAYRERTGKGQFIDVSLLDSSIVALSSVTQGYLTDKSVVPSRRGNGYAAGAPGGAYLCKDGKYVVTLGLGERAWKNITKAMGLEHLRDEEKFLTNELRSKNYQELDKIIEQWTLQHTVEEAVDILLKHGLPAGPIMDIEEVYNDEHINEYRKMFASFDHPIIGEVEVTNQAVKMSETNPYIRSSSPILGQHNEEILKGLGYTAEDIEIFKETGVI